MKELRCEKCNKLLAKTTTRIIHVEIQCKRCGKINNIHRNFNRSFSENLQKTIIKK